jgi:Acetyltransferase (GNAT) family
MNIPEILKQQYPDVKEIRFDVYQDDKRKTIFLTGFIVNPMLRSKGLGSEFMTKLTDLADQIGYKITLTPDSSYGGNVNRLKDFYQRFGFIFNKGKNRDFSHREDMYRLPKNQEINEEGESTSAGSTGNSKATGKKWETGLTRGKANPISNHGEWETGIKRGHANPVTTNEQIDRMKKLIGY